MNRGKVYTCGHEPLRKNLKKLLDAGGLSEQIQGSKT